MQESLLLTLQKPKKDSIIIETFATFVETFDYEREMERFGEV